MRLMGFSYARGVIMIAKNNLKFITHKNVIGKLFLYSYY